MPTRTRTWIGVGLVCLAWLQGAGAQNAPGEDPVVLDRKVSIQMLPNGAAPRSGYMNPSSEMPAWQKARIARYEAKAFSDDTTGVLTNNDVVTTANAQGMQKTCVQEVGSNTVSANTTGSAKYGPNQAPQVVVLRGDLVNICK